MSSPEAPQLPPKPEVKQRPPIPTKPPNNTTDTSPPETTTSPNSGNVKKIVNIFSQPESKTPSGGTAKVPTLDRKQPQPPVVKPRRKTKSSSQTGADSAPPLPPKTRQNHSSQKDEVESKEAAEGSKQERGQTTGNTDGGRSGTVHYFCYQESACEFGFCPHVSLE